MIVVDASLAAKWILPEEHTDKARALYRAAVDTSDPLVAPPLLPIEITNILRQKMRREALPLAEAQALLERFLAFPIELTSPAGLHGEALELAVTYELAAAYDAHYLGIARLLGCDLWTADERLVRSIGGRLPFVKWIGDYASGQ